MKEITNPILPGFNPDPSILRVGDDYYIATSTFEWFPGVQIYHSKDLINWKLIAHPLNRLSQLDMRGNPDSGGIWAPCLTYDKGIFYLMYTDVKGLAGAFKDTHNYMVTTTDITGQWSEPVYLNSSGYDPSMFHDEDGRKWVVNTIWDFRKGKNRFGGILLQEFSLEENRLTGSVWNIFKGTILGITEGAHLYKINGWYYLLAAEGGTGLNHAVTVARSRTITGPYEVDPNNPMLTSRNSPLAVIQRAGHADIVETQNGEWYMVHLGSRPLPRKGKSILGRETSIQKLTWTEDGWLRLEAGGNSPLEKVPAPDLPEHKWELEPARDDFDQPTLNINFQTLRVPLEENTLSLTERPGYLRLKGKENLSSRNLQSLVARRQQAFTYTAAACVEFDPENFQQMAGMVCYYNNMNFHYIFISNDEKLGKCLSIMTSNNNILDFPLDQPISIERWKSCYLRVTVNYDVLQFSYSADGKDWTNLGPTLDASILSDEHTLGYGYTGAFVGICCQDLSGQRMHADFDWFEYIESY